MIASPITVIHERVSLRSVRADGSAIPSAYGDFHRAWIAMPALGVSWLVASKPLPPEPTSGERPVSFFAGHP